MSINKTDVSASDMELHSDDAELACIHELNNSSSLRMVIPKPCCDSLGLQDGDRMVVVALEDAIVMAPLRKVA